MSKRFAVLEWLKQHKLDVVVLLSLMIVAGTVSAVNMTGYPQRFEDEGTYVSQAWAIKEHGTLTHYTYWYDHPPMGWMQIAAYLVATNGLDRYGSAITAGREFMLVMHLATIVLLYALARRLKIGIFGAAAGTLLYSFSPLSVEFSRYVLLDNIALPWLLGAFILALSPKKSLVSAVGSAFCMAIAILSKETFLVLLPVLLYILWRSGDKRNRRYVLAAFGVVFSMVSGAYVLYAALKNELLPGEGHVSLVGTFLWQLFGREGTGSIFDPGSQTRGLIGYWLSIDYWLLAIGVASLVPCLIIRSLRPAGLSLLIGLLMLLRTGYLPYPYVIILLPFAALCAAGLLDKILFKPFQTDSIHRHFGRQVATGTVLAAVIILATFVAPVWSNKIQHLARSDEDRSSRETVQWISRNIPQTNRLVVESALWTDLETKGFNRPDPVWLYKTETDPSVSQEIGDWQGIDYIVLNGPTVHGRDFKKSFPTVSKAIENSSLIKQFGEGKHLVLIYKVADPAFGFED